MAAVNRKPRGEGHERRAEIIDAARRIFADEGLEKATMRRVAQVAKISPAAVYIYFKDKQAILAAIRDETFAELEECTSAASQGIVDPRERIRRHLKAYLDFAIKNPDAYRITFRSHLIRAPRRGRPTSAAEAVGRGAFTALLQDVAAVLASRGTCDEARAHSGAEAAWAAIHGLATLVIDVPEYPQSGLDEALGELTTMVLAGLETARERRLQS